jgi:hypothetical protein
MTLARVCLKPNAQIKFQSEIYSISRCHVIRR